MEKEKSDKMKFRKNKTKQLMASLNIDGELRCSYQYEVVSEREGKGDGDKEIDFYTVINELKEEKEYPEYFFDLESK